MRRPGPRRRSKRVRRCLSASARAQPRTLMPERHPGRLGRRVATSIRRNRRRAAGSCRRAGEDIARREHDQKDGPRRPRQSVGNRLGQAFGRWPVRQRRPGSSLTCSSGSCPNGWRRHPRARRTAFGTALSSRRPMISHPPVQPARHRRRRRRRRTTWPRSREIQQLVRPRPLFRLSERRGAPEGVRSPPGGGRSRAPDPRRSGRALPRNDCSPIDSRWPGGLSGSRHGHSDPMGMTCTPSGRV
jgi:hypothetical protein